MNLSALRKLQLINAAVDGNPEKPNFQLLYRIRRTEETTSFTGDTRRLDLKIKNIFVRETDDGGLLRLTYDFENIELPDLVDDFDDELILLNVILLEEFDKVVGSDLPQLKHPDLSQDALHLTAVFEVKA